MHQTSSLDCVPDAHLVSQGLCSGEALASLPLYTYTPDRTTGTPNPFSGLPPTLPCMLAIPLGAHALLEKQLICDFFFSILFYPKLAHGYLEPLYMHLTISWATSSGVSFSKSKVNSMAPLSLGLPFSFLGSSTQSRRAMVDFLPWSSSASSTRTPVSSAKKAWLSRSLISYLERK